MHTPEQAEELSVFRGMSEAEIDELRSLCATRWVQEGQTVLRQDEGSRSFYCLLSGGVEVLRDAGLGPRSIAIIKAGECFGEIGFFAGEDRTASIRAVDESELLVINQADLDRMSERSPRLLARLLHNILTMVSIRFADVTTRMASMVFWLGS
ncbi:MAG: cyclic nucleotide-binding domain-containing protein [Acidobacteriota bacterium]